MPSLKRKGELLEGGAKIQRVDVDVDVDVAGAGANPPKVPLVTAIGAVDTPAQPAQPGPLAPAAPPAPPAPPAVTVFDAMADKKANLIKFSSAAHTVLGARVTQSTVVEGGIHNNVNGANSFLAHYAYRLGLGVGDIGQLDLGQLDSEHRAKIQEALETFKRRELDGTMDEANVPFLGNLEGILATRVSPEYSIDDLSDPSLDGACSAVGSFSLEI